jgi:hypothetical protein
MDGLMENPINMHDLGVYPLFRKPPYSSTCCIFQYSSNKHSWGRLVENYAAGDHSCAMLPATEGNCAKSNTTSYSAFQCW